MRKLTGRLAQADPTQQEDVATCEWYYCGIHDRWETVCGEVYDETRITCPSCGGEVLREGDDFTAAPRSET